MTRVIASGRGDRGGWLGVLVACIVLVAAVGLMIGCATVELSSDSAAPIKMSGEPDRDYTIVRSFDIPHSGWFTLWGLVTIANPDIQQTLEAELTSSGGDAIINVKIIGQTTFLDGLVPYLMYSAGYLLGRAIAPDPYTGIMYGTGLGSLTIAMLSTRTYRVSGDALFGIVTEDGVTVKRHWWRLQKA